MNTSTFQYSSLAIYWKLMLTGFVIILGSGYLAAVFNAALSVGMTPQAIAEHYADKSLTPAEMEMMDTQGFVEEEFSLDDEEEDDSNTEQSIQSNDMQNMKHEMESMSHDMDAMSHDMQGMDHDMAGMKQGDDTLPPQILAQVSHVHLLVFSLLFFVLASLINLSQVSSNIKTATVVVLFVALWGDIISLNLVRFVSADFAWMTAAMGTLVGLSFAFIILRVLWELWFCSNKSHSNV